MNDEPARVIAVCRDREHLFSKCPAAEVVLLPGLGVEADAHQGVTVQHRSRVAVDPTQPNLRQVHLIGAELFAEVAEYGYQVEPGQLGENVTTAGLDLLGLPRGTRLSLGEAAVIELTGLRNPCQQINGFRAGLLKHVLNTDERGEPVRRAGVMSVVLTGGVVRPGDPIAIHLPPAPDQPLERV